MWFYRTLQGYLIYIFFNENMNIDNTASGAIQVNEPGALQILETQLLTMPADGYFYTPAPMGYLTNYSDQQVYFDNLTIRHQQGFILLSFDKPLLVVEVGCV